MAHHAAWYASRASFGSRRNHAAAILIKIVSIAAVTCYCLRLPEELSTPTCASSCEMAPRRKDWVSFEGYHPQSSASWSSAGAASSLGSPGTFSVPPCWPGSAALFESVLPARPFSWTLCTSDTLR